MSDREIPLPGVKIDEDDQKYCGCSCPYVDVQNDYCYFFKEKINYEDDRPCRCEACNYVIGNGG